LRRTLSLGFAVLCLLVAAHAARAVAQGTAATNPNGSIVEIPAWVLLQCAVALVGTIGGTTVILVTRKSDREKTLETIAKKTQLDERRWYALAQHLGMELPKEKEDAS